MDNQITFVNGLIAGLIIGFGILFMILLIFNKSVAVAIVEEFVQDKQVNICIRKDNSSLDDCFNLYIETKYGN